MNCTEAREALLVADLTELRGETGTPLVRHVGTCPDCRRAASLIANGTAHLGSAVAYRRGAAAALVGARGGCRRVRRVAECPSVET